MRSLLWALLIIGSVAVCAQNSSEPSSASPKSKQSSQSTPGRNPSLAPPRSDRVDASTLPDDGQRRELRRGVVVVLNLPGFRHGEVCGNIHYWLSTFVRQHPLGRVLTNDSGLITERNPDTVRGGDVTYYSFQRVAKGESPV